MNPEINHISPKSAMYFFSSGSIRFTLILSFLIYISSAVLSQDYITFPNGNFIKVKIIEIGTFEIKYKLYNNPSDQLYSVARSTVYNISYENGKIDFLNGKTAYKKSSADQVSVVQHVIPATQPVVHVTPTALQNTPTGQYGTMAEQTLTNAATGSTQLNPSAANLLNSFYASQKKTSTSASEIQSDTHNPKRPTAFRNYQGYISGGAIMDEDEFSGANLLVDVAIGKSDFGFGVDYNTLSYSESYDYSDMYSDYGIRLSYHIPISTFLDPYAGVRGYSYKYEYRSTNYSGTEEDFSADVFLGTRLMYRNIGLYIEYHLEEEYTKVGFSISLYKN